MEPERIYDALTTDWQRLCAAGLPDDPRYLHEHGRPVVQIWGYYYGNASNHMSPELARRLADFFAARPERPLTLAGGDWNWQSVADPAWQAALARYDGYCPWNVGNWRRDAAGQAHAALGAWPAGLAACRAAGRIWLPVVYPGFGWDNLTRQPHGSSTIPRRGGRFFWEQFAELARLGVRSAYVAMFDEVDEGTAIFKVTSDPPLQGGFDGLEGLPSDWYLRLAGEGGRLLRGERAISDELPISP
jgi:hypothetical protein